MTYTTVDARKMKPAPGPHPAASAYDKDVGQALGVRAFGIYQIELPPGGQTVPHDHLDDAAEDVYAILAGTGTGAVVIDGHNVPVRAGHFIAVTPEPARYLRAGDGGLVFIAVCGATRGEPLA